ncbi:alpha/beta hydrolase [Kitasatospora xanthocidica]
MGRVPPALRDGEEEGCGGHTAYGRGSSCVTDAVDDYLVRLKPLAPGSGC